jgi:hypothetical protein
MTRTEFEASYLFIYLFIILLAARRAMAYKQEEVTQTNEIVTNERTTLYKGNLYCLFPRLICIITSKNSY